MEDRKNLTVHVSGETVDRLDRIADKIGISRTQLIRNLLECALDETEQLEAVGLITLTKWTRTLQERLREKRAEVESQVESQVGGVECGWILSSQKVPQSLAGQGIAGFENGALSTRGKKPQVLSPA
jgi:predicted transcriptional regulator